MVNATAEIRVVYCGCKVQKHLTSWNGCNEVQSQRRMGANQMSTNMSKGNHQPLNPTSSLILLENSWLGLAQVLGR